MAYNIKAAIRAAKDMQYEPIERRVREATNNDAWGVSTSMMSDIARSTHHHDEYPLLYKMLWKRLLDVEHVMHVQKALILTDYLLRNGAERFVTDVKRKAKDISSLQKYKQYDANNRDVGTDVRAKAKAVYELLTNEEKLASERAKAVAIRDVKLTGIGSDGSTSVAHSAAKEFDQDRYNAETPRGPKRTTGSDDDEEEENNGLERDWEKDPTPEELAAAEAKQQRKLKKAKAAKEAEAAAAAAAAVKDEEAPEVDGDAEDEENVPVEKKKNKAASAEKKKKKKKKTDGDQETPDTTAPPSAEASAQLTPVFAPAANGKHAAVSSFDPFEGGNFDTNGFDGGFVTSSVTNSGFSTPAVVASVAPSTTSLGGIDGSNQPKKSRKKRDAEATSAASQPSVNASASTRVPIVVAGNYDLTDFANIPTPRAAGGVAVNRDLDILTGTNAPTAPLEEIFTAASLMDAPIENAAFGEEDDGFLPSEEPALLDQPQYRAHADGMLSPTQGPGSAQEAAASKKDLWDLAADFTNIDNIKSAAPQKKAPVKEVVSMAMMRNLQPFGGMQATPAPPANNNFFGGAAMQQPQMNVGGMNPMMMNMGGFQMQQQMQMHQQQHQHFAAMQQQQQQQPNSIMDLPFASLNASSSSKANTNFLFDSVPQAQPKLAAVASTSSASGPRW